MVDQWQLPTCRLAGFILQTGVSNTIWQRVGNANQTWRSVILLQSLNSNQKLEFIVLKRKFQINKDVDITGDHLVAFRISKEEVIYNWLQYLIKVIENYFNNTGRLFDNKKLFQERFDDQLWQNIENFLDHLSLLPLWKDRSMAATIFAGKQNYDFWKTVFQTGKSPDGADVLAKSLNYIEMIKPLNCSENC